MKSLKLDIDRLEERSADAHVRASSPHLGHREVGVRSTPGWGAGFIPQERAQYQNAPANPNTCSPKQRPCGLKSAHLSIDHARGGQEMPNRDGTPVVLAANPGDDGIAGLNERFPILRRAIRAGRLGE